MYNRSHLALTLLLVGLMPVCPGLPGLGSARAATAAGGTPALFAKTGTVECSLVGSAGRPITNTVITVVDGQGNEIFSTVTDENGQFILTDLEPGQYSLKIGEKHNLQMTVSSEGASEAKLILPDGISPGSAGTLEGAELSGVNWTYVLVAGLAIGVFVPVGYTIGYAAGNDDDAHN